MMSRYDLMYNVSAEPSSTVSIPGLTVSASSRCSKDMARSFDFNTTGLDVVKEFPRMVRNKTFVITECNEQSIGGQAALDLARGRPKELILLSPDRSLTTPIIDKIAMIDSSFSVLFIQMDLASQPSIRKAAAAINNISFQNIDVIINNAGMKASSWGVTEEGIEMHFGVNHIGHFLFTNLLMHKIPSGGRIVNISSSSDLMSNIQWVDYNFRQGQKYDESEACGQSKTANVLFSLELTRRLKKRKIHSFSVNPGSIGSRFYADLTLKKKDFNVMFDSCSDYLTESLKPIPETTASILAAALDPGLAGCSGAYLNNCIPLDRPPCAQNPKDGDKLWTLSELLVSQRFSY